MTVESLQAEMDEALQMPGFPNTWTQPIRNRLDMLFTGIKTPIGIKILGSDLGVIQRVGQEIENALADVAETRSVYAERVTQGYFTDIAVDRAAIARHGLTVEDVQEVIQTAIGGEVVTRTVEGRERYPVNVRYERAWRDDIPALERVLVKAPSGAQVPLGELASITLTPGPGMIRNEDGLLAGYIYVDTASQDMGGYVAAAQAAVARTVTMPPGYTLVWSGQYEFQVRARERLKTLLPIVLVVIFFLLYMTFHSVSESAIVMLSVVYAMTGGVIAQWWLGYNFSVAVWVGYIALYGIAVQTGVVMVVYLHEALDESPCRGPRAHPRRHLGRDRRRLGASAPPEADDGRHDDASLLPILWSTGVGSDVMKPIAAPILGGMVTSTIHVLIITPVIFYILKARALRRGTLRASPIS